MDSRREPVPYRYERHDERASEEPLGWSSNSMPMGAPNPMRRGGSRCDACPCGSKGNGLGSTMHVPLEASNPCRWPICMKIANPPHDPRKHATQPTATCRGNKSAQCSSAMPSCAMSTSVTTNVESRRARSLQCRCKC